MLGRLAFCSIASLLMGVGHVEAQDDYAAVRDVLETCFGCHGPNGASTDPKNPILAGQHLHYLYVQLKDFKSGLRASPIMSEIAEALDKEQMLSLAKFFSEQEWPRIAFTADRSVAKTGERAASAGQCVQCHRGGYEGDSRVPRLAGQHYEYLNQTMLDFKSKARDNSPAKSSLLQSYSEADIAAMAEYLAGL